MNRLQSELRRLFGLPEGEGRAPEAEGSPSQEGRVRCMVLGLRRATWTQLSQAWQGVQADLDMPAPAIAVSGHDSHQLWFSLSEPMQDSDVLAFLDGVRRRYLGDFPRERIRMQAGTVQGGTQDAAILPPVCVAPERWSAFITPDLAPLFDDEPWLDHPPGDEAQADLLSRLRSTPPRLILGAVRVLAQDEAPTTLSTNAGADAARIDAQGAAAMAGTGGDMGPRAFLLAVMRDPAVDLRLRIEAAKALLPHVDEPG